MIEVAVLVVLMALTGWIVYTVWPERVVVADGKLVKRHGWRTIDVLPLTELAQIKYHYHAVVGFTAVWEFISVSGRSFTVATYSNTMPKALAELEGRLRNFSVEDFNRKFQEGDVEDTLDVWSAGRH